MRSDHADEKAISRVMFIFKIKEQCYKVERSFKRINKRNENAEEDYTFEQHFGKINAKTFDWEQNPKNKVVEIRQEVEQILGFNAAQFKQIVLLPQGRFQELLTTKDQSVKKEILIKIFDASIFEKITAQLKQKATQQLKFLKEKEESIKARLEAIQVGSLENLQTQIETLENQISNLKIEIPDLDKSYKVSQEQYQIAKHLTDLYLDLDKTTQELDLHLQKNESIEKQKIKKLRAEQAEVLRIPLERIEEEKAKINEKEKEIQTNRSIIIKLESELKQILEKIENLEEKEDAINENRQLVLDLKRLQPKFLELDTFQIALDKLNEQHEKKQAEIKKTQENSTKAQTKIEGNTLKIDEQQKIFNEKSGLEIEVKELEKVAKLRQERQNALVDFEKIKKNFQAIEKDLKLKSQSYDTKRQSYEDLDMRWRKSQSAILAQTLEDGEPCPVCGASEHPNKAPKTNDFVSNEILDKAKKDRNDAEKEYDTTKEKFLDLKNELENITLLGKSIAEQLGEWKDITENDFAKKVKNTQNQLVLAQKSEAEITKLKSENTQLTEAIKQADLQIKNLQAETLEINTQVVRAETEIKNIRENLPETIKNEDALLNEVEKLEDAIFMFEEQINKLKETKENKKDDLMKRETVIKELEKTIKKLESDLDDLERELKRELKNKSFVDLDDLKSAFITDIDKHTLQREIDNWNNKKIELESHCRKTAKQIEEKPKPDLIDLMNQLTEKETLWKNGQNQLIEQNKTLQDLQSQLGQIQTLQNQFKQVEAASKDLIELSALANGDNDFNQDFQTHVLSAYLDEIVDAANVRLRVLSQERYELRRTEEITHGNRRAGLELKVFDSYTGKERFVQNLSGGETFFTSLALALGLADTATSKAGGIRLDSMFIDEGFGTLDSTTLDLAIQTLMNLDGEYRTVGIISHVAELRERIASSRVEIIKEQKGSRLEMHVR